MLIDTLIKIRDLFYLSCFDEVLKLAKPHLATANSDAAAAEIGTLYFRAKIALGQFGQCFTELRPLVDADGDFVFVKYLAEYRQARTNDDDSQRQAVVKEITEKISSDLTGIQAVLIAHILLGEDQYSEAISVLVPHTRHTECVALLIQTYLIMGRSDLAKNELSDAKEWADDAILLQLAESWVNLSIGGEKCRSTAYIFDEFGINAAISASTLCGQAVCNLMMQRYPEAESLLLEAQSTDENNPDVLANLAVLSYMNGRPTDAADHLSKLKTIAPKHPFLIAQAKKNAQFDSAASAFTI